MRKTVGFLLALILGSLAGLIYGLIIDMEWMDGLIMGLVSAAVALFVYLLTPSMMARQAASNDRDAMRREVAREMRRDEV